MDDLQTLNAQKMNEYNNKLQNEKDKLINKF